jgi:carbon storage regulator
MLVLSRRVGESIQIGDDTELTVIEVRGEVVRIGITAPQSTQIWRKELWDAIVAENQAAAKAAVVATPPLSLSVFSKLGRLKTVKPTDRSGTGRGKGPAK